MSKITTMAFLDTIFLVLIMVLAKEPTFEQLDSVELTPPQVRSSSDELDATIESGDPFVITLDGKGKIRFDKKKISTDRVGKLAEEAYSKGSQTAVIRTDRRASFEQYIKVSREIGNAGFRVIRVPVIKNTGS